MVSKSSRTRHLSAQYKLGYMYDYGQGISQNRVEAAKWYKKAAEQENVDAQYRLGNMFSTR